MRWMPAGGGRHSAGSVSLGVDGGDDRERDGSSGKQVIKGNQLSEVNLYQEI